MLCKYYLQLGTDTVDTESPDCMDVSCMITNLDSIKVSYARVDLGGVVRKCGSQIVFTDKARDAIIAHYSENYLQSSGVFAVYIADNNWNYSKVWECPLDFATLQYDANTLTIGCIDNSAAAIIKANKKSKYELDVSGNNGLKDANDLLYGGVLTKRSFVFSVVGATPEGETTTDMVSSKVVTIYADGQYTLYVPAIGISSNDYSSEKITIMDQDEGFFQNSTTYYNTDDGMLTYNACNESKAGFISCISDCVVHVQMNMAFRFIYNMTEHFRHCRYYFILVAGNRVVWRQQAVNGENNISIDVDCPLASGEKVAFVMSLSCFDPQYIWNLTEHSWSDFHSGLRWGSNTHTAYTNETHYEDNPVAINVVRPIALLRKLLDKMFESQTGNIFVRCAIQEEESLISKTLLVAAESVRQISTNKIYSSFADFCNFMEAVFGYVYTLEHVGYYMDKELREIDMGDRRRLSHIRTSYLSNTQIYDLSGTWYKVLPISDIVSEDVSEHIDYTTEHSVNNVPVNGDVIVYLECANIFACFEESTGTYYAKYGGNVNNMRSYLFNDENNHAKEMLCVRIGLEEESGYLYGIIRNGNIVLCDERHSSVWLDSDENNKPVTELTFKHRSDVFKPETIKRLSHVCNLSYSLDDGVVYSDIEVGYPKQDYDNNNSAINEYNFTNHYKCDANITENTLSLICPYRADCYGMEELLVKSSDDESTKSDNDVFIVIAKGVELGYWQIDRTITVQNAYTETVFNAAIAPNMIVKNNEDYIGCFTSQLKFTSSDGNSSAVIGSTPMSADISITKQLFKAGKISIDTDDHIFPENWDGMIEFEYGEKTYKGYLDSIDICFANLGTITYNIIEKCIE